MPTVWAISATVCSFLPSGPVAWYMRRTVAALAALSLGRRPPARPRARAASRQPDDARSRFGQRGPTDGVILCPEGFYKSNRQHIEKLGLSIRLFPAQLDRDGKIDAWHLRRAIQTHREQLCALLFTMPGNPLIATYSAEELQAIGRVVVEEDVRVIVDATLDAVVPDYVPLAAITVDSAGKPQSLFDRTVTIAGLSKGHHAVGPYKIGAAITGDARWRADIRRQLAVPLQRETTALVPATGNDHERHVRHPGLQQLPVCPVTHCFRWSGILRATPGHTRDDTAASPRKHWPENRCNLTCGLRATARARPDKGDGPLRQQEAVGVAKDPSRRSSL